MVALPALVATQLLTQGFIRRRSRSRWLAHQLVFWGCILAALVTFPLTLGPAALRERRPAGRPLPGVRVPGRHAEVRRREHRRLADLPRPRHRRGAGARRRVHLPAPPPPRPGRAGRRAQRRLPGPRRPVRGVGHRPVPDRVEHLARRPLLLGAQHHPRAHRDPRPDVPAVRQAVPHLPAPRQPRRRLLQAGQRRRARRRCAGGAASGSPVPSRSPTSRRCCRRSGSTTRIDGRRQLPGHLPAVPAGRASPWPSRRGSEGSADGPTPDQRRRAHRARSARTSTRPRPAAGTPASRSTRSSRPTAASAASSAASSSRCTTTRSSASSPGTTSRSTRASSAPRASSATCRATTPTACCTPWSATRRRRRVPADQLGRRRSTGSSRRSSASRPSYGDDAFAMLSGRLADQREELPGRQVRPPRAAHREPRLQRPLLHGVGRRRQQEGPRRRPGPEPVERHPPGRRGLGRRLQRGRDLPHHHQLHLAGPRPRRQAHRAGPPRRAPGPHRRPVPAGPSRHRLGPVRRGAARADPQRLARPRVHRRPHRRLRRGRRGRGRHDPGVGRRHHRASRRPASRRPPSCGAPRRPG